MSSTFVVGGISTGIDYNELIDRIIEIQRQPINILENKRSEYNEKLDLYSELESLLKSLQDAVDDLRYSYEFYEKEASVSDSTVLDVSVSGSASVGNYSISITSLASEEKEVHNGSGLTSSTDVINSSGTDKAFQYTYAGTQTTITVPDGTTLEGLRDLINEDPNNPGVTATIVNDGTNYRLVLTGNDSGSSNTITIDSGTTLDGTDGTVDFTAASFTETKSASDAVFTVDGLQITRSTNTISDVITGITFDLKKAGASATISVTADIDAIKTNIQNFVNAYNDVISFLSTHMDYDTATGEAGVLIGESTARHIQEKLRSIISSAVSGVSGDINMLAMIGITTNSETGQLEIDTSELDEKLGSSLDEVAELFTLSSNGIAHQIYDYIDTVTSSVNGAITLREEGISDIIENINETIEDMEYRLEKERDQLVKKFTALEALVSGFDTMSNYLATQVNLFV